LIPLIIQKLSILDDTFYVVIFVVANVAVAVVDVVLVTVTNIVNFCSLLHPQHQLRHLQEIVMGRRIPNFLT
jgi:hypothetical protein